MNYWRCGLTSLVGSDVNWCILGWIRALVRYSVDSLDFKRVLGVGQQFTYEDPGVCESQLAWNELNIVPTTRAAPSAASAALADDVVDNVITTASFPRRIPLQHQWSLVHTGDDVLRSRRHSWKKQTICANYIYLWLRKFYSYSEGKMSFSCTWPNVRRVYVSNNVNITSIKNTNINYSTCLINKYWFNCIYLMFLLLFGTAMQLFFIFKQIDFLLKWTTTKSNLKYCFN